jgi:hypothetical protein
VSRSPCLRRRWLLGAAALGTISMWDAASQSALSFENVRERVRKKLVSLLHEPERARKVGMAYLKSPSGRLAPPLALAETVLAELGPDTGTEPIRLYIVERIRREFQDVQVVSLDGWIMSPTEAQLCGLATIGPASRP